MNCLEKFIETLPENEQELIFQEVEECVRGRKVSRVFYGIF